MAAASIAAAGASRTRIPGIDTARALAIALAMLSHCFIHFGVWELLSDQAALLLRSFTRAATPTFIILFGMMLEIVYLKMLRRGERQGCWVRLVARAIQCYLLYLLVVTAGILGGNLTAREGLLAALFLSE
ncbi:MAG TPA: heparan-alpha-glucosaminide N-acetyltransferase domain-containing protein, partial [Kiloniellaceae bacterium]|nr:heparan-alpha-glucosaminide N-acetyltransferase domain-containing protein [Kiloniellaceae bacterium]